MSQQGGVVLYGIGRGTDVDAWDLYIERCKV